MLLLAYQQGFFPMAEHAQDDAYQFVQPHVRALLPIKTLHVTKSLKKSLKKHIFDIQIDTAFEDVIRSCADRKETWINDEIIRLFTELHEMGYAHSVECWREGRLVGGLYGLALGGTFCGESMFSKETNASKIALVHLCARLSKAGFTLLDAQFHNPHLEQFGLYEISHKKYMAQFNAVRDSITDFKLEGVCEEDLLLSYLTVQQEKNAAH